MKHWGKGWKGWERPWISLLCDSSSSWVNRTITRSFVFQDVLDWNSKADMTLLNPVMSIERMNTISVDSILYFFSIQSLSKTSTLSPTQSFKDTDQLKMHMHQSLSPHLATSTTLSWASKFRFSNLFRVRREIGTDRGCLFLIWTGGLRSYLWDSNSSIYKAFDQFVFFFFPPIFPSHSLSRPLRSHHVVWVSIATSYSIESSLS